MSNEAAALYDIRDGGPDDNKFILATFLRGFYYGEPFITFIPKDIFMAHYKKVVIALLNAPGVVVNVACLKTDPDVILGYSILSPDYSTIHWVYVKRAWRKQGIATTLLPKYPTAATHISTTGRKLMIKYKSLIYNPFLL